MKKILLLLVFITVVLAGFRVAVAATTIGNDITTSGVITSSNTGSTSLVVSGAPAATATGSLVQLGPNVLTSPAGGGYFAASGAGTYLVANPTSYTGDFLNFQINGDSKFRVRAPVDGTSYGLLSVTNDSTALVHGWDRGALTFIGQSTTESTSSITSSPAIALAVNNGVQFTANHSSHNAWGAYLRARTMGSGATNGTLGSLISTWAEAAVYGTAMNITDVKAINAAVAYWSSSGTVTNAYGIDVSANAGGLSSGTVTNMYGVRINAGKNSQVTNAWGIVQAGSSDSNFFAGKTRLSSTSFSVTAAPSGYLEVLAAPTASANYGLVNVGPAAAAFDGATAGFFTGNSNGTQLAVNAASGYGGSLVDMQVAGASKFKVDALGNVTAGNFIMPASGETMVDNADAGNSCSSSNKGAIVIDATNNFFGCDGTNWQLLSN